MTEAGHDDRDALRFSASPLGGAEALPSAMTERSGGSGGGRARRDTATVQFVPTGHSDEDDEDAFLPAPTTSDVTPLGAAFSQTHPFSFLSDRSGETNSHADEDDSEETQAMFSTRPTRSGTMAAAATRAPLRASVVCALRASFSTQYLPPGPADVLLEGTNVSGDVYHWLPSVRSHLSNNNAFSPRPRLARSGSAAATTAGVISAHAPPPLTAGTDAPSSPLFGAASPSSRRARQRLASSAALVQGDLDSVTKASVQFKRRALAGGAAAAAFGASSSTVAGVLGGNRLPHDTSRVSVTAGAGAGGVQRRRASQAGPPTAEPPASPTILTLSTADLDAVRLSFFAHTKRWSRHDLADRMKRIIIQLMREEVASTTTTTSGNNDEGTRRREAAKTASATPWSARPSHSERHASTTTTHKPDERTSVASRVSVVSSPTSVVRAAVMPSVPASGALNRQSVEDFIANSAYLSGSESVPVDVPTRYVQAARVLLIAEYEVSVKAEMDAMQRKRFRQFEENWHVHKAQQRSREKAASAAARVTAAAAAKGSGGARTSSGDGVEPVHDHDRQHDDPLYPATCPMSVYTLPAALADPGSSYLRKQAAAHAREVAFTPRSTASAYAVAASGAAGASTTPSRARDASLNASATARHKHHPHTPSPASATGTARGYVGVPSVDALLQLATGGRPLFSRQFAWDMDLYDDISLTLRSLEQEHFEHLANKQRAATAAASARTATPPPPTGSSARTTPEPTLTEDDAFFSKPPTFSSSITPLSYRELDSLELPLPTFVYIVSRLLFRQCYANTCFPPGLFTRALVDPFFFPDSVQCFPAHYFACVPIQGEEAVSKRFEYLERLHRRIDHDEEVAIAPDDFLSVFFLLQPPMQCASSRGLDADTPVPWLGLAPEEEDELLDKERPPGFPALSSVAKRHRHALRDHLYELSQASGVLNAVEELLEQCRRVALDFFESVDTEQRGYVLWSAFTDALIEHAEVVHQRRRALDALRVAQTSASVFDRYMVEPMPRQLVRLGYTGTTTAVKHSGALVILEGPYDYAVCNSAALMSIRLKLMVRSTTAVYDDLTTIALEAARSERYRSAAAAAGAQGRTVPPSQDATRVVNGYNAALSKRPWRVNQKPPGGLYVRYEDGRRLQDETAMSTLNRLRSRKRAAIKGGSKKLDSRDDDGEEEDEEGGDGNEGVDCIAAAGASKKSLVERTELLEAVALRHVVQSVPMTLWTMHSDLMLRVYTTHHFIQAVPEAGLFRFTETVTSLDWAGGGVPAPLNAKGVASQQAAQRKRQQAQRRQQQEAAATTVEALDARRESMSSSDLRGGLSSGDDHDRTAEVDARVTSEDERQHAALRELLVVGTRVGDVVLVNAKQMLLRIPRIASESNPITGMPTFIGNAQDASAGYADLAAKTHREDVHPYIAARQHLHEGIVSSISVLNSTSQPPGVLVTASMDGSVCVSRIHATVTPEGGSAVDGRARRSDAQSVGQSERVPAGSARIVALRTFRSGEAGVRQVIHAPTAQMLVVLSAANRVFLYGTTNQCIRVELYDAAAPHYAPIVAVVVEEGINQVLSIDESGLVKVWNLSSCLPLTAFQAIEPYGEASASAGGTVGSGGGSRGAARSRRLPITAGGGKDDEEAGSGVLGGGGGGGATLKNARAGADTPDLKLLTRKEVEKAAGNHRGRFFATVHSVAYDHETKRLLVTGYRNAAMGTFVSGQGGITAHLDSVRFMAVCRQLQWLVSLSQTDVRGWRVDTGSMELGIRVHNPEFQLLAEERAARSGGGGGAGVLAASAVLEEDGGGQSGTRQQDRQVRQALERLLSDEHRGSLDRVKRPPLTMTDVLKSVTGTSPGAATVRSGALKDSTATRKNPSGTATSASGVATDSRQHAHNNTNALPNANVACACLGARGRFIFYGLSSGDIRMHRSDSGRLTKTYVSTPPTVDDVLRATLRYRYLYLTSASPAPTSASAGAKTCEDTERDTVMTTGGGGGVGGGAAAAAVGTETTAESALDGHFLAMSRVAVHAGTSMLSTRAGKDSASAVVTPYDKMSFPQRAEAVAMLLFRLLTEDNQVTSTSAAGPAAGGGGGDARAARARKDGGADDDRAATFHLCPVSLMCLEGSQELLAVYTDGLLRYFPLAGTSSCALRLVIPPYLVSKAVYYLQGGPSVRASQRLDLFGSVNGSGAGRHTLGVASAGTQPKLPAARAPSSASLPPMPSVVSSASMTNTTAAAAPASAAATAAASVPLLMNAAAVEADAVSLVTMSPQLQLACVVHMNGTVTILDVSGGASATAGADASNPLRTTGLGLGSSDGRASVVHTFAAPTDDEITAACFLGAYPALVLADRRGRLHFYVVRGAPLLAMWEEVMQLVCYDRTLRTTGAKPHPYQGLMGGDGGARAGAAASTTTTSTSTTASAAASTTSPGAPLVWSLQMQRDTGAPSSLTFDPVYSTLYVGTRDGYLASFLVRKLILALDLRPLNVSDTELNLSVYWTALKFQQERCNEEAIRNILLVLFDVTPEAVCQHIARSHEARSAGALPTTTTTTTLAASGHRSSVHSVATHRSGRGRNASISSSTASPLSTTAHPMRMAISSSTGASSPRARRGEGRQPGEDTDVLPPSPHLSASATRSRSPLAKTTATTPAQAAAGVLWRNSLAWVYSCGKPLLTRPTPRAASPSPASAHTVGATMHTRVEETDAVDGVEEVRSSASSHVRPRGSSVRRASSLKRGSAVPTTTTTTTLSATATAARARHSSTHTEHATGSPPLGPASPASLPIVSLADASLGDVLLASAVLNDAIHMLRLRYEMEAGLRGSACETHRHEDSGIATVEDGVAGVDEVMLTFIQARVAEREREQEGSSPKLNSSLRGTAATHTTHSSVHTAAGRDSSVYASEAACAVTLEAADINVMRQWVRDALEGQRKLLTSAAAAASASRPARSAAATAATPSSPLATTLEMRPQSASSQTRSGVMTDTTRTNITNTEMSMTRTASRPGPATATNETAGGLVEMLRLEILTGRTASAMANPGTLQLLYATSAAASPSSPLFRAAGMDPAVASRAAPEDAAVTVGNEYSLFNGRRQHPITTRWLEPLFARHALFMSANSPLMLLSPAATLERARMEHRERDQIRLALYQERLQQRERAQQGTVAPRQRAKQCQTLSVSPWSHASRGDDTVDADDEEADVPDGHADDGDEDEEEDGVLQQQLRQDEFIEGTIPKLVMEVFRRPGRVLKEVSRLSTADLSVTSLCTRPNGLVFVGCGDGSVSLWTPYAGARIEQVCPSTSLTRSILNVAQSVKHQFRFMRAALQAQQQREAYGAETNSGSIKARIKAMLVHHYADQQRLDEEAYEGGDGLHTPDTTQSAATSPGGHEGGALPRWTASSGAAAKDSKASSAVVVPAALRKLADFRTTLQLSLGYLTEKDVHQRHLLLEDLAFLPLRMARVAEMEGLEEEAYDAAVDAATARLLHLVCGADAGHTAYVQYYKRAIGFVPTAVSSALSSASFLTRRRHPMEVLPDLYTLAEALDVATLREMRQNDTNSTSPSAPYARSSPHRSRGEVTAASMNERALAIAFAAHMEAADTLDVDYVNTAHELIVAEVRDEETREYVEMRDVVRLLEAQEKERVRRQRVTAAPTHVGTMAHTNPRASHRASSAKPHRATSAAAAQVDSTASHRSSVSATQEEQATLVRALSIRQRVGAAAVSAMRTDIRQSWISVDDSPATGALLHRVSGASAFERQSNGQNTLHAAAAAAAAAVASSGDGLRLSYSAASQGSSSVPAYFPTQSPHTSADEDPFANVAPLRLSSGGALRQDHARLSTSSPHVHGAAIRRSLLGHGSLASSVRSTEAVEPTGQPHASHAQTQCSRPSSAPGDGRGHQAPPRAASLSSASAGGSQMLGPVELLAVDALRHRYGVQTTAASLSLSSNSMNSSPRVAAPSSTEAAMHEAALRDAVTQASPGRQARRLSLTTATTSPAKLARPDRVPTTVPSPGTAEKAADDDSREQGRLEEDPLLRMKEAQRAEAWLYSTTYTLSQPLLLVAPAEDDRATSPGLGLVDFVLEGELEAETEINAEITTTTPQQRPQPGARLTVAKRLDLDAESLVQTPARHTTNTTPEKACEKNANAHDAQDPAHGGSSSPPSPPPFVSTPFFMTESDVGQPVPNSSSAGSKPPTPQRSQHATREPGLDAASLLAVMTSSATKCGGAGGVASSPMPPHRPPRSPSPLAGSGTAMALSPPRATMAAAPPTRNRLPQVALFSPGTSMPAEQLFADLPVRAEAMHDGGATLASTFSHTEDGVWMETSPGPRAGASAGGSSSQWWQSMTTTNALNARSGSARPASQRPNSRGQAPRLAHTGVVPSSLRHAGLSRPATTAAATTAMNTTASSSVAPRQGETGRLGGLAVSAAALPAGVSSRPPSAPPLFGTVPMPSRPATSRRERGQTEKSSTAATTMTLPPRAKGKKHINDLFPTI